MYSLENGVQWTNELKEAFKHNVTRSKILWNGAEINENNYLRDFALYEERYISDYGFVGTATAKKLELNLLDVDGVINLENKEITLKIGADYNGNTYYINYGNFIVDKSPEVDETNGKVRVVAYDYMIKFNKPFDNSSITYPCTLLELLQNVCTQAGVTLATTNFANANFTVENNQFEGATLREVLQNIAKCAFSWARIGQDNSLYLDFSLTSVHTETITIDDYFTNSFKKANEYYGPVNQVTYADSYMEGNEERVNDQTSISENGLKELVIYDNLFAYTTEKRSTLIQEGTRLLGLTYMPITQLELIGLAYLDCTDAIQVETLSGDIFTSRVFNHTIKYNGALHDSIVTEGTSDNEEVYKNTATDVFQNQRTQISIDKANKTIELISENVTEQNEQIGIIRLQYNELLARISDIADITTSGESSYASVNLTDVNDSQPILIKIHPIAESISYLYPRNNLYLSDNLIMKSRKLRFTNTTTNEVFYWELPTDLWYYNSTVYDELELSYGDGTDSSVTVTRRCTVDSSGTISPLATETTETYLYPTSLMLTNGDYVVDIEGYSNGYLYVQLMAKNIYTTQFYTKVETNSLISSTANSINLSVDQKLSNYSNTTEMNTSIQLSKTSILNSVQATYVDKTTYGNKVTSIDATLELKLNTTDLISEINASADRISLTAGRLVITSGNFKLDASGNITCQGGKIGGFTITDVYLANGTNSLGGTNNSVYLGLDGISCGTTFKVTKAGALTCTSGTIGGFTISNDYIANGTTSLGGANNSVYLGLAGISCGTTFQVTKAGVLTCTSGSIGGWTVNNNGLTNGTVRVNSDGSSTIYTVADLIIIRGHIMGYQGFEISGTMISHYDFDGDGVITSRDYMRLKNLIGISPD